MTVWPNCSRMIWVGAKSDPTVNYVSFEEEFVVAFQCNSVYLGYLHPSRHLHYGESLMQEGRKEPEGEMPGQETQAMPKMNIHDVFDNTGTVGE